MTETKIQTLERKKDYDLTSGEIETAHHGYLGSRSATTFKRLYAKIKHLEDLPLLQ